MLPRVTVVIPTFNRFDYLCSAIQSCLDQTEKVNIIVVDHGSSDPTHTVDLRFGDNILYVRREIDSGPHFAWLDGCLLAQTELVKLLFDDDTLEPTYIEKTARLFSPSVGFVFSRATIMDQTGAPFGELFREILPHTGIFSRPRDRRTVRLPLISPSAAIFRKEDLIDALFINKLPIQERTYHGVGPDHFVKLLALMRRRGFGFIDEPLANFRAHSESITIAATSKKQSTDLRLAYLDVANIALVLQIVTWLRIIPALRLTGSLKRRAPRSFEIFGRIRYQVARHGLVPLRQRTSLASWVRSSN